LKLTAILILMSHVNLPVTWVTHVKYHLHELYVSRIALGTMTYITFVVGNNCILINQNHFHTSF